MKKLCVVLSLVFAVCVGAQGAAPKADPRSAPVTLAVKGEALSDIMPMLSEQTGVKLTVSRDIADQKVTVFVDKRPLRDLMADLETVFGYQWYVRDRSDGGKSYLLDESARARRAREDAQNGEMKRAFDELDGHIRTVVRWSREKKPEELDAIIEQFRGRRDLKPEEQVQSDTARSARGSHQYIARLYTTFSQDTLDALLDGCTVCFDTNTDESKWRLPNDAALGYASEMGGTDPPPTGYCLSFSVDNAGDALWPHGSLDSYTTALGKEARHLNNIGGGGYNGVGFTARNPMYPPMVLPRKGDDSALDQQVSFTAKELNDESEVYGQTQSSAPLYISRSDMLALLHRKIGLQAISDHHSVWFTWKPDDKQTVRYTIEHLGTGKDPRSDPALGWDGGCLLMRERFPYDLDAAEIPNRLLRQWRADLARDHCFGLEDHAGMASLRREQHSSAYYPNGERLFMAKGVDYSGVLVDTDYRSMNEFAFYGSLTDAQKRRINGDGLRVADLSMDQLGRLADVLEVMGPIQVGQWPFKRRVGMYKYGLRVDKPQADDSWPVLMKLEKRGSDKYVLSAADLHARHGSYSVITAPSADDAWKQFEARTPGLNRRSRFFGRDVGYVMVARFADGTVKERPIEVYEAVGNEE